MDFLLANKLYYLLNISPIKLIRTKSLVEYNDKRYRAIVTYTIYSLTSIKDYT